MEVLQLQWLSGLVRSSVNDLPCIALISAGITKPTTASKRIFAHSMTHIAAHMHSRIHELRHNEFFMHADWDQVEKFVPG